MKFRKSTTEFLPFLRSFVFLSAAFVLSQVIAVSGQAPTEGRIEAKPASPKVEEGFQGGSFRVEKVPVEGGAQVVTIFANHGGSQEIPLLSILRDTLGDDNPENDRLRYVWMHTYPSPSLRQKAAAFVPFLYTRTSNKKDVGSDLPPVVIDVQRSDKALWNQIFWTVFKRIILGDLGAGARMSGLQYHQNAADYRRSAVAAALTTLSLYQETTGERVLTDTEVRDVQARLFLKDKMFGWHMPSENLDRVYGKETAAAKDFRGHNWELLRQYSEAQGLYFEPIEMPDGTARHVIVWTSVSDIAANKGKDFNRRFLNIRNPWTDKDLADWKGYTQVRWFDDDDRQVDAETPNAKPRTMIPLALYGLDHPKIPMILIDFRDRGNPKFREMSKRILNDFTVNALALSQFSSFPYFLGRFIYDLVPGRRGLDINQASRVRSYSQLKLLLSLDNELEPELRETVADRIEHATLNPLENDTDAEAKLARKQYANLMEFVRRPDGLAAKLSEDRREEMARLRHNGLERALFSAAHTITFGRYTHRERGTPDLLAEMDLRRQLDFHERSIRETAFRSADPDIDSDVVALKRSLVFVARYGSPAGDKTTRAISKIFSISKDDELQTLCLAGLYRINNSAAKNELLAIYRNLKTDDRRRDLSAHYLKLAVREGQRIYRRDAAAIAGIADTSAN
jgi:hypothetical protein